MERTFYIETLGCPKNRVDAEIIWAQAARAGLVAVDDPAEAEVIVVNTCAFIESAVSESLDTVVSMGRYKREGRCRMLVISGCLPARYGRELVRELPEVDLLVGPAEAGSLGGWLAEGSGRRGLVCRSGQAFLPDAATPRANSLGTGSAYLKVAEGCSRSCSFCLIPGLRGPQRSRPMEDLLDEAETLVRLGIGEIVLVAQDLARWGRDLGDGRDLADLVDALARVEGLRWIRLMYLFPTRLPERLIRVVADRERVLAYLDLPFQHADPGVLERMKRGGTPELFTSLVDRLRAAIPGVVLRSTLMTGFPGEDREAFARLEAFVEHCRFERLGVFAFSAEEGTTAAAMPGQVPAAEAARRRDALMERQRPIAAAFHQGLVGTALDVMVEGRDEQGRLFGRAWNQAPEVDGQTALRGEAALGAIVPARVTGAGTYDLEAELVPGGE